MRKSQPIRIFNSRSEAYRRAFRTFLDHTDQKRNAERFLHKIVHRLPNRGVFIDAGAGNGELTKALASVFDRTIAIEPNPFLLTELKQAIPEAITIAAPILAANPKAQADLVLCSHTVYYIPEEEQLAHLDRLVSWMSPSGVTVVIAQNPDTDCMAMLDHFFGQRFDLHRLAQIFRDKHRDRYDVTTSVDPAAIEARDLSSAYAIAEFLLNPVPEGSKAPARSDVEDYLAKHFLDNGVYRISVDQDFLEIRRHNAPDPDKA